VVTADEPSKQEYVFTRYTRLVLPLDGYVFWVQSNLVAPSSQFNAMQFNTIAVDGYGPVTPPDQVRVKGTVHYATTQHQDADKVYASNAVHFNTMQPVQALNAMDPSTIWICTFDGIRFAFSHRDNYFAPVGEQHYVGQAIYSSMESQIIDSVDKLAQSQVVSNSLPFWLSMNGYSIFYGIQQCPVTLYPSSSQLLDNLVPPFGVVHIEPSQTIAMAEAPLLSSTLSHTQLARDIVKVTLYGLNNDSSLDFQDFVIQFTIDNPNTIGIMNMPIIRDEKETQSELLILAKKKSIEFEISYNQSRSRDIAQKYILSVIPTYIAGTIAFQENFFVTENSTPSDITYFVTENS
jgi:hypothetical protein